MTIKKKSIIFKISHRLILNNYFLLINHLEIMYDSLRPENGIFSIGICVITDFLNHRIGYTEGCEQ